MAELRLGMAGNIFLDFVPISLVIPDLLAVGADRHDAPQRFDSFLISTHGGIDEHQNDQRHRNTNI